MSDRSPVFDVLIAGAGIVGAACALAAAEAGLSVAVVEPGVVGGGATAAGMGHLVALEDDPAQFALSAYSLALWQRWNDLPGAEFSRCGTLWIAANDDELAAIAPKREAYRARGIGAQLIDAQELAALEPELRKGLAGALHVPGDAVVYPPRVARVWLDRARGLGACLFAGRRVAALETGAVRLDDATRIVARRTVLACGVATRELVPELPLRPRKGHLLITERAPGFVRHQLVELGYLASAHGNADSSVAFNVQPRSTGQVLIGSSRQYGVEHLAVESDILRRMLARAAEYLPRIGALTALRAWTGFRPATADGLPLIGPWPRHPDLWLASGHEGLGVTTSLATARLIVDALTDVVPAIDPTPYRPGRVLAAGNTHLRTGSPGVDARRVVAAPPHTTRYDSPARLAAHADPGAIRPAGDRLGDDASARRTPFGAARSASSTGKFTGPPITLHVDGMPVQAECGSTVAAAIGRHAQAFRRSPTHAPRAPACGMGICGECRATVDGSVDVLTCQLRVAAGMDVRTLAREPCHA